MISTKLTHRRNVTLNGSPSKASADGDGVGDASASAGPAASLESLGEVLKVLRQSTASERALVTKRLKRTYAQQDDVDSVMVSPEQAQKLSAFIARRDNFVHMREGRWQVGVDIAQLANIFATSAQGLPQCVRKHVAGHELTTHIMRLGFIPGVWPAERTADRAWLAQEPALLQSFDQAFMNIHRGGTVGYMPRTAIHPERLGTLATQVPLSDKIYMFHVGHKKHPEPLLNFFFGEDHAATEVRAPNIDMANGDGYHSLLGICQNPENLAKKVGNAMMARYNAKLGWLSDEHLLRGFNKEHVRASVFPSNMAYNMVDVAHTALGGTRINIINPCAGWGARVLGAYAWAHAHPGVAVQMTSCDVNAEVARQHRHMLDYLQERHHVLNFKHTWVSGATESVVTWQTMDAAIGAENRFIFTSPPYFNIERYPVHADDTGQQSTIARDYGTWHQNFLQPTAHNAAQYGLKADQSGLLLWNVANPRMNPHPLVEDFHRGFVEAGLTFIGLASIFTGDNPSQCASPKLDKSYAEPALMYVRGQNSGLAGSVAQALAHHCTTDDSEPLLARDRIKQSFVVGQFSVEANFIQERDLTWVLRSGVKAAGWEKHLGDYYTRVHPRTHEAKRWTEKRKFIVDPVTSELRNVKAKYPLKAKVVEQGRVIALPVDPFGKEKRFVRGVDDIYRGERSVVRRQAGDFLGEE